MQLQAKWIKPETDMGRICPLFSRTFRLKSAAVSATLSITALGVYEASLNGRRIGEFILAPGWTAYEKRLQVQTCDITDLLCEDNNSLTVIVGKGWYRGRLPGWPQPEREKKISTIPAGLIAQLDILYEDGSRETVSTDETWTVAESRVRESELYDGETYDAAFIPENDGRAAVVFKGPTHTLIPQQGEEIREQERLAPACIFTTPKGETVVDFGQEITGYVEISLDGQKGECVALSHAEVLDKEGNFYTENYRGAKAKYLYFCKDGHQTYKPRLTFYGFRYIRIDQFPGGPQNASPANFTAIVLHSDMKRTGHLSCSNPLLNKLFDNIIWGQKGNFVDVPTDCPQRDERLGWTGDAQAFIRTACYNFDAEKFYMKWLADMAADQREDGMICHVIPKVLSDDKSSAAWADAAAICPWELYLAYGNPKVLEDQFSCMEKWVGYITSHTATENLWTGGEHYGDWLGLDAPSGSYKGSTREDFIASAFYAHSVSLVIRAGRVLGRDVSSYEALYDRIRDTFRETWPVYTTQTECVLAAHFKLAADCQAAADQLARMVTDCGTQLKTGFVGTPYLLHVLSDYGHEKLAYSLLLREKYPSWLYPVTKGATTVWEHWDGIMENGDFWSSDMNSFNHYAYGAVADWVYGKAAGISPLEEAPGYQKVRISPIPDERLGWLKCSYQSRHGLIRSEWSRQGDFWRYEIETPVDAVILIDKKTREVSKGTWLFYSRADAALT